MRRKKIQTKLQNNFGTGENKTYKPWIEVGEFGSKGTTANPIDWKTGRTFHLLSQGELLVWYIMNFNDDVEWIKEQFPLNPEETILIAQSLKIKHPIDLQKNEFRIMTTDFLVKMNDGSRFAISVKSDSRKFEINKRQQSLKLIEQTYWQRHGVEFMVVFKNEINEILARNISMVTQYYNIDKNETDKLNILKHLIATKQIIVDMTTPLELPILLSQNERNVEQWINTHQVKLLNI